jgi:hypothetical protein
MGNRMKRVLVRQVRATSDQLAEGVEQPIWIPQDQFDCNDVAGFTWKAPGFKDRDEFSEKGFPFKSLEVNRRRDRPGQYV